MVPSPTDTGWRACLPLVANPCFEEPDAVVPHVRFDERRLETEPWSGLRHRPTAKAAGNSHSPDLKPPRQSSTLPNL